MSMVQGSFTSLDTASTSSAFMTTVYDEPIDNALTNQQNITLEALNDERASAYYPAIVLVCLAISLGLIGNSLVVYVYCKKFSRTTANMLITLLAVFDLVNCLFALPYEIVDMLYPYMYGDLLEIPCKIIRSIEHGVTAGSGLSLVIIAYERYKKICSPMEYFSRRKANRLIAGIVIYAFVMGLPHLYLDRNFEKETGVDGITGSDCTRVRKDLFNTCFQVTEFTFFFIFVSSLVAFYVRVGVTLFKRNRWAKRSGSSPLSTDATASADDHMNQQTTEKDTEMGNGRTNKACISLDNVEASRQHSCQPVCASEAELTAVTDISTSESVPNKNSRDSCNVEKEGVPDVNRNIGKNRSVCSGGVTVNMKRVTLIAACVTLSSIISFLPVFSFEIASVFSPLEKKRFGDKTLDMMTELVQKSYVISAFINPIIYSCLNRQFHKEARQVIKGIFCCQERPPTREIRIYSVGS